MQRGAAVDKSKLKEIEDKDAQIAKLIYEQEKLKLKKAKSQRQRQKSEEQRQNPRVKHCSFSIFNILYRESLTLASLFSSVYFYCCIMF